MSTKFKNAVVAYIGNQPITISEEFKNLTFEYVCSQNKPLVECLIRYQILKPLNQQLLQYYKDRRDIEPSIKQSTIATMKLDPDDLYDYLKIKELYENGEGSVYYFTVLNMLDVNSAELFTKYIIDMQENMMCN